MKSKTTIIGLVLAVLWLTTGCAALKGSYGSIVPDDAAGKSFESVRMDPTMNYYYSGGDASPNAIIGLKKAYELDNELWKPIEPNAKLFKELIRGMQSKGQERGMSLYGYVMKDPQGKPLGIWYSVLSSETRILKMGTGNKVVVYTPEADAYKANQLGEGDAGHSGP